MAVQALDPAEVARRAEAALRADVDPGCTVSDPQQIVGGTSSLTYSAMAAAPGEEPRKVVIKVAPPGVEPVRNRDVLRQARLLSLLSEVDGVAVPLVLAADPGAPVEVPPLFVMSFVPGESYEPMVSPEGSSASNDDIAARAQAAARMAARLHSVDTTDPRLGGERVTDLAGEVQRWSKAFATVDDDLRPGAEQLGERLEEQLPDALLPSVLHGDWRLGNMQCNGPSIDAVIDWEIWSLGDRRLDLAWFLLMIDEGHPNRARSDTGLPAPAELVAIYEEASGVRMEGLEWFEALVRYKQAAASALIAKNNRKVPQPGVDVDRMVRTIPLLMEWGHSYLGKG
jgi:aminoglycoside phosphotransferase (APT) family kinase protein